MNEALETNNILDTGVRTYFSNDVNFLQLKENIDSAVSESKDIVVMTANDVNSASHYLKNFKALGKKIEYYRKAVKQPFLEKGKEIDEFFKELANLFSDELDRLDKELKDFQKRENEKAEKAAAAERKRLEEEAIQLGIQEEERRRKRADTIAIIKSAAEEMKVENPGMTQNSIMAALQGNNGFPADVTPDEWSYILGNVEELEVAEVEPAIVAEVEPETRKISSLNSSGLHTRRTKKYEITNFVEFVRSLSDKEILLYLEPNRQALTAERSKFDFEAHSSLKGVRFYFDENLR